MRMWVWIRISMLVAAILVTANSALWADDVEDAVKEGLAYYQSGDFSNAAGSLEYAAQLIRQKKGGEMESLLPQPLAGWTAEESSTQAMGAAMFGGGVTVERSYTKGDSRVTVQFLTDSPMLQGMMMMLTNPVIATADGGKLEKIKGQKALVKYNTGAKQGEITLVVVNKILVLVEGRNVSKADLTGYAAAVDYQKMAAQQ